MQARNSGFTTRRATAVQRGQQIFNLAASFQTPEDGFEHQLAMPAAPDPEGLLDDRAHQTGVAAGGQAAGRRHQAAAGGARLRLRHGLHGDGAAGDGLVWTTPNLQTASLDHALWFHRPFDFHRWRLYDQDSPSASGGRGFVRGSMFSQEGVLLASMAQDCLMRQRSPRP